MNDLQHESRSGRKRQLKIRRVKMNFAKLGYVKHLLQVGLKFRRRGTPVHYTAAAGQQLPAFYVQWLADLSTRRKLQAVLSQMTTEKHREEQAGSRGDCCE